MKCPRLAGNYMFSCSARKEVYVPSSFEYSEYCNSERYDPYKACSRYPSDSQQAATGRFGAPETSETSRLPS